MGTHPIFESDFDCLTECCLVSPQLPVVRDLPCVKSDTLAVRPTTHTSFTSFPACSQSTCHFSTSRPTGTLRSAGSPSQSCAQSRSPRWTKTKMMKSKLIIWVNLCFISELLALNFKNL